MLSEEIFNTNNEKIIKKNYKKMKKIWDENEEKINDLEFDINVLLLDVKVNEYLELLNNKKVIEYLYKCNKLESLKKDKSYIFERLSFLHQHLCEHPAFFVIDENIISQSHEKFYTCSCIECGKGLTKKENDLNDIVLIYPKDMNNADKEYKEYHKEYKKLMKRIK